MGSGPGQGDVAAVPARVSDGVFLLKEMAHGNKNTTLGLCEDSPCKLEVRTVCL